LATAGRLTTGAFAKLAGVTVRTLRFYDRSGLLPPSRVTTAGHRLYSEEDLVRLQQVMTLKFIGFSLREIRTVLDAPAFDLARALRAQRQVLADRARQMQTVISAIDTALQAISGGQPAWETVSDIIKAVQMEQHNDWLKKYYTEEQLAALAERAKDYTPEQQAADAATWARLQARAKELAQAHADPAGEEAQALAAEWQGMIDRFTGGDPSIAAGLNKLYQDRDNLPDQGKGWYGERDEETEQFTKAMMAAFRERQK